MCIAIEIINTKISKRKVIIVDFFIFFILYKTKLIITPIKQRTHQNPNEWVKLFNCQKSGFEIISLKLEVLNIIPGMPNFIASGIVCPKIKEIAYLYSLNIIKENKNPQREINIWVNNPAINKLIKNHI